MSKNNERIISEWTEDREDGQLGLRIVFGNDDDPWLEARWKESDEEWGRWAEEDLYDCGWVLLMHIPDLLKEERARIRRELLEWIGENSADNWDGPDYDIESYELRAALDRICPEVELASLSVMNG